MNIRRLAHFSMFLALSVVGSYIKIPSMVGSLALDAVPGYFAALCISPALGAGVASLGHITTAAVSGFPLGVPIHALVSLGMATAAFCAGLLAERNLYLGATAGILVNGLVLPALFIVIPAFGMPFFLAATPSILVASILNVALAAMLYSVPSLRKATYGQ